MIETLILVNFDNIKNKIDNNEDFEPKISLMYIIISLIISFGSAFIAFKCNKYENEATRLIYTIFAFLFPGLYLIYFFIRYAILGYKCDGKIALTNIFKK
jgi:hypothetical protein